MPYPRLANAVDRLHVMVILFWLLGFAFYWRFPSFRHGHAWFVVISVLHQKVLRGKCILTILSDWLRGQKKEIGFIARCFGRYGLPRWLIPTLIFLTFSAALATLLFWK